MKDYNVTYEHFSGDPFFSDIQPRDEQKGALEVIQWAYDQFENIVYACSLGAEGVVLLDLISKVKGDAEIVFLDTGLHFQETYELLGKVRERYPEMKIRAKTPELDVEEQSEQYGPALWNRNPDQCCYIRKIKPLEEALDGKEAWLSGLRREQSPSRSRTNFVNKDERFKNIKVCPLIHWTWEDIWHYIRVNSLDYNELHDRNYPSVGCIPCTSKAAGDGRSGRWQGFNKTECGLHTTAPEHKDQS